MPHSTQAMSKRIIHVSGARAPQAIEDRLKELSRASNDTIGLLQGVAMYVGGFGFILVLLVLSHDAVPTTTGNTILGTMIAIGVIGVVDAIRVYRSTQCTRDFVERIERRHRELTKYTTADSSTNYNKEIKRIVDDLNNVYIPPAVVANGYEPVLLELVRCTE